MFKITKEFITRQDGITPVKRKGELVIVHKEKECLISKTKNHPKIGGNQGPAYAI